MTELDLEIPGLAAEIINEYGKLIKFGRVAQGAYDRATATYAPVLDAALDLRAIVEPYRGQRMLAGLVEADDLKLTIAGPDLPNGATPEDSAIIDGVTFKVKNVMPTYSGDLIAIYEIQIGR